MGDVERGTLVPLESSLKYHPEYAFALTTIPLNQGVGHFQSGSLTGAVSSQSVTEEFEGTLETVGNRLDSAMA